MSPVAGKIETESHLPKADGEGAQVESKQSKARALVHNSWRHCLHWGETRKTQDHNQGFTAYGNIPFPVMALTNSLNTPDANTASLGLHLELSVGRCLQGTLALKRQTDFYDAEC